MISIRFVPSDGNDFEVTTDPHNTLFRLTGEVWNRTGIPDVLQRWRFRGHPDGGFMPYDVQFRFSEIRDVGIEDGDVIQVLSSINDPETYWEHALRVCNWHAARRLIEDEVPLPRNWTSLLINGASPRILETMLGSSERLSTQEVDDLILGGEPEASIMIARDPLIDLQRSRDFLTPQMLERLTEMEYQDFHEEQRRL